MHQFRRQNIETQNSLQVVAAHSVIRGTALSKQLLVATLEASSSLSTEGT